MSFKPDYVDAAIHRERAERHYVAAERFRKLRLTASDEIDARCWPHVSGEASSIAA